MIDFKKELAAILEEDPLGLLNTKPKTSGSATMREHATLRESGSSFRLM